MGGRSLATSPSELRTPRRRGAGIEPRHVAQRGRSASGPDQRLLGGILRVQFPGGGVEDLRSIQSVGVGVMTCMTRSGALATPIALVARILGRRAMEAPPSPATTSAVRSRALSTPSVAAMIGGTADPAISQT